MTAKKLNRKSTDNLWGTTTGGTENTRQIGGGKKKNSYEQLWVGGGGKLQAADQREKRSLSFRSTLAKGRGGGSRKETKTRLVEHAEVGITRFHPLWGGNGPQAGGSARKEIVCFWLGQARIEVKGKLDVAESRGLESVGNKKKDQEKKLIKRAGNAKSNRRHTKRHARGKSGNAGK